MGRRTYGQHRAILATISLLALGALIVVISGVIVFAADPTSAAGEGAEASDASEVTTSRSSSGFTSQDSSQYDEQYQGPDVSEEEAVVALVEDVAYDVDAFWDESFATSEIPYSSPYFAMVYEEPVDSGCGPVDQSFGPLYCPLDQTFYYPVNWVVEPETGHYIDEYGDFAVALAVAHEMAHHVQEQMDILEVQDISDLHSIESELQADCFAGVWANSAYYEDQLEDGDIDEALSLLDVLGDSEGTPVDDPEAHGSSEQRREWFMYGYDTGDPTECVTY